MKKVKTFWKYFFSIVVVIVLLLVLLWFVKTPIISSYLSSKLKVDVSIDAISAGTSHLRIDNFKINNPKTGYKDKVAFLCKEISADYSFSSLRSDPVVIDEIKLKDIFLEIECKDPMCGKNNWTHILNNINEEEEKTTGEKEVKIKKLVFENLKIQLIGMGIRGGTKNLSPINRIELNNISSKEGFPTDKLVAAIFRHAGLKDYLKDLVNPKNLLETITSPFKGITGFEEENKAPSQLEKMPSEV